MIALDSSVLIASVLTWHDEHAAAAAAVARALTSRAGVVIPAHALFEAYSVMTRMPDAYRVSPRDAEAFLRENFSMARIASFPSRSVWPLLARLAGEELGGSITYDAAILAAAQDAGATALLTLNPRDFERLSPRIEIITSNRG